MIRLGMSVSLSGRYAVFGRQALDGLQRFVRDRNASGGVREPKTGRPASLVLRFADDRSEERLVRTNVEHLLDDGVDLLIGPYGSGLVLAAAEVAERREHVLWNHGGSSDDIFERGYRWVVGLSSPASSYLVAVLDCIRAANARVAKVAVLAATSGFASRVASGVLRRIDECGLTPTAVRSYPAGQGDFRSLLRDLEGDPPDVLLGVGRFEDDVALARELAERRFPAAAVGLVGAGVGGFGEALGEAAEGFFGPTQWDPRVRFAVDTGPSTEEVVASEAATTDYPGAQGYAAGLVAARCLEEAGALRQESLRAAASRLRFTTFYGPFAIDPSTGRQTAHSILVTQWQDGVREIVWPAGSAGRRARPPAFPGRRALVPKRNRTKRSGVRRR